MNSTKTTRVFLKLKGVEDEKELLDFPKSTWHSPKWASKIFHEWQMRSRRQNRDTNLEECSAFAFDCTKVQHLDTSITQMNGLNFFLAKFMQYLNQMVNSIPCQNLMLGVFRFHTPHTEIFVMYDTHARSETFWCRSCQVVIIWAFM